MKWIKVLLILMVLMMVALFAFGCAAESFTYTYAVDDKGAVHLVYLLVYDAESEDASIVKEQALYAMDNYVESCGFEEYATISDDVEGEVRLELLFPTVTDYYIAYERTGREPNEPISPTKVGFINRYDEHITSYLNENEIEMVRSLVSEDYRDFSLEYCDFYYTFGTSNKLTTSEGKREEKDGMYYYTWKLQYGEETEDMVVTEYYPNGMILFSIVISVFILSLALIFVIIIIKRKKEDKLRATEVAAGDIAERGERSAE